MYSVASDRVTGSCKHSNKLSVYIKGKGSECQFLCFTETDRPTQYSLPGGNIAEGESRNIG